MTRIHSHRRGKSQSFRPMNKKVDWVEFTSEQINEIISNKAKLSAIHHDLIAIRSHIQAPDDYYDTVVSEII